MIKYVFSIFVLLVLFSFIQKENSNYFALLTNNREKSWYLKKYELLELKAEISDPCLINNHIVFYNLGKYKSDTSCNDNEFADYYDFQLINNSIITDTDTFNIEKIDNNSLILTTIYLINEKKTKVKLTYNSQK